MFDVGFWEVGLVLVLGLLILGPERLPKAVRMVGLMIGRARAAFYSIRNEMDREFQIQEMRKAGRSFEQEMNRTVEGTAAPLTPPPASDDEATGKRTGGGS